MSDMNEIDQINKAAAGTLPDFLGIKVVDIDGTNLIAEMHITSSHLAPNGYLHAGSVVTLADSSCGFACLANLPDGATGFTTIELKSNHLGTAREGMVQCIATPVHLGRTTQVWDATVSAKETGKTIALFRCTQMILHPRTKG